MLIDDLIWTQLRATTRPDGVRVALYRARYGRRLVACGDTHHLYAPDEPDAAVALYERLAGVVVVVGAEARAA